jgi:nitrate reductase delta subunit
VLRSAVAGVGSPYADIIEAVCLTLPPVDAETERRYLELISAGPPTEMVGLSAMGPLEPFAPGGAENVEVRR